MEFQQQLIDRTRRYFLAHFGLEISDETADEYLGQFAELYVSMAVFAGSELCSRTPRPHPAPNVPSPDVGLLGAGAPGGAGDPT
jgi:hypothetical protein